MGIQEVREALLRTTEFRELTGRVAALSPGHPLLLRGAPGSFLAFAAGRMYEEREGDLLLITAGEDKAQKLRDDAALLLGESGVRYFGSRPSHSASLVGGLDMSSTIAQTETLVALSGKEKLLILAPVQAAAETLPRPGRFSENVIQVRVSEAHGFQKLVGQLAALGFEQKDFVEGYGDFAVRGGIIDVFPFVGENPVRLEFWGDTVESIREFDAVSQRSIRQLQSASIVPSMTGPVMTGRSSTPQGPDEGTAVNGPPADASSLFEYLRPNSLILFDDPALIQGELNEMAQEGISGIFSFDDILTRASRFPVVANLVAGMDHSVLPGAGPAGPAIDFHAAPQPAFGGNIRKLIEEIAKLEDAGLAVTLASDTKEEAARLRELIDDTISDPGARRDGEMPGAEGLREIHAEFITETLHSGFLLPTAQIALFTEHEIFGRLKRRGLAKRRRFKGISQKELQQLRRGDYVVHVDHGIGSFAGLSKIRVGGVEQEVVKLLFLEDDVLYVNLNFVNRIQKYSSQEGHVPSLTKLGGPDWERLKQRAKKRIKDLARDLIALYAKRKHEKGHAFSQDTHWQKELEASFMYEDTADQATATLEVKQDMESPSPMDRLICGDVGFGKTEVAVRAAFKAVMDGTQVALLVPTTILAIQHYNTFHDRLSRYTTRVENLTRFKSKKDQERIVQELMNGSIDIVIGTHRLLSKDIGFRNLGLLIIDEEHRFGVAAKEKLRKVKATVDTLALTATPIPRTLHFSLIGARDLSLIETAPRNRLPIQTDIIAASDGSRPHWQIIREAIIRELHRGGQVYVVHDRVQNIDAIANEVKHHVPEARVRVAHGQMHGHELEKTMLDFLQKEFDVLVATKIIESGLDIPSVNTIVINRADRFGLAELYQLRGRVGRSNVQAYAFLLVPPLSVLPKHTIRRLQAIEEFTELGSGFNLALRDLEIRGAGNIFGAEQSGEILEMGFEMYERIVREAVDELRQDEFKEQLKGVRAAAASGVQRVETVVDSDIEALIPDFFVESDTERLDIYRRLYAAGSDAEIGGIREELRDRFGEYPPEVENLFRLIELRLAASRAGFPKISLRGGRLVVTFPDAADKGFYGEDDDPGSPFRRIAGKVAAANKRAVRFQQTGKELTVEFSNLPGDGAAKRIDEAKKRIEELISVESGPRPDGGSL